MQREFSAFRGSFFSLNMQNEQAEQVGFWAGFMSVTNERSNTLKLGNVYLVVKCLYNMHLFTCTGEKKKD